MANYNVRLKRRKRRWRRRQGAKALARQALSLAKKNAQSDPILLKDTEQTSGVTVSSTPATGVSLQYISQDDTQSGRRGNEITAVSLSGRFQVDQSGSAGNTTLRICIVRDNQQVADTDISWSNVYSGAYITAPLNPAFLGRYQVIYDEMHNFDVNGRGNCSIKFYKKLNHKIRYNGTSFSDIQQGGFYLLMLSDEATNTPTVKYSLRLRYKN